MLQLTVLAFSLSADAFAASIAKGVKFPRMSLARAAGIAFGFGVVEALAPLLGYGVSTQFAEGAEAYDHWIAFAILAFLGARMLCAGFGSHARQAGGLSPTWGAVLATALCTSIDAAAVGLTLPFLSLSIPLALFGVGIATFTMTFMGLRLGVVIGAHFGQWAERAGGVGLIAIGAHILVTHLSV